MDALDLIFEPQVPTKLCGGTMPAEASRMQQPAVNTCMVVMRAHERRVKLKNGYAAYSKKHTTSPKKNFLFEG